MKCQRALPDPTLAGTHGDDMAHAGEPVSDPGTLLGNLLEDSRPSVADDVLVALHDFAVAYTRGLIGPRQGCVHSMHGGRVETEPFEALLRHFVRMDLWKPDRAHRLCTKSRQQLDEPGSVVVDETPERHDVGRPLRVRSTRHVEQVCLDSLVGGDRESSDIVLPRREGLNRALPARMTVFEESIGGEVVDRDGNDEAPSSLPRSLGRATSKDIICQDRFLLIPACTEQFAYRGESLGKFCGDSGRPENRELRA